MMNDEEEATGSGPLPSLPMDEVGDIQNVGDFDAQKIEHARKKRRKRCVIGGSIVLLLAVVLGAVLGVTLSSKNKNDNESTDASSMGSVSSDQESSGMTAGSSSSDGSTSEDEPQSSMNIIEEESGFGGGVDEVGAGQTVDVDELPNSGLRIEDDAITITAGTDDMVEIPVLDNDDYGEGISLFVKDIVSHAEYGDCTISIDFNYIYYIPDSEDFTGFDECTYKACVEGEESDEICDTAVVKITIKEETKNVEGDDSGSALSLEMLISSSFELTPDDPALVFEKDAVVAIDGDTVVVGSSTKNNAGLVLVYSKVEGEWVQEGIEGKLSPPKNATGSNFGSALAIYGDTIIVGASSDSDWDADIYFRGIAHVYTKVVNGNGEGVWLYQDSLLAPDGKSNDSFGYDVALYENTAVVSAWHWNDDTPGPDSGSAHVFVRNVDKKWTYQAKLESPDEGDGYDSFGNSVAVFEDTVVVGAWRDDNEETGVGNSGAAYVFVRDVLGGTWAYQAKLMDDIGETEDRFGNTVAIYEDTIVVGARGDNGESDNEGNLVEITDSGSAYVFVRDAEDETLWKRQVKLVAPDGSVGDQFGNSVAIYEDTIVVGARWDDSGVDDSGSAHVFTRYNNQWSQAAKLLAPEGEKEDYFAFTVSVHDGTVVVGSKTGETHVFPSDAWNN